MVIINILFTCYDIIYHDIIYYDITGILVKIVEDKPVAINHFASYLRQNQEFEELIRFYELVYLYNCIVKPSHIKYF